jgi:hypothetical protein
MTAYLMENRGRANRDDLLTDEAIGFWMMEKVGSDSPPYLL